MTHVPLGTGNGFQAIMLLLMFLQYGVILNVNLAIFNLIPIPPFDGSRIFYVFIPTKWYFKVMKYERYIQIVVLVLLFIGVLDPVLSFLSTHVIRLLYFICGMG